MRITKYKTLLWDGIPQLVKETAHNYNAENLRSPQAITDMMRAIFQLHIQTEEYVYEICFNAKMKPVGVFEIFHGTINTSICNPREMIQKALLCGAENIVIVHNHPSGDVTPSADDYTTFERVKQASEIIGIRFTDAIIIAEEDYFSFKEMEG